jgi:hypothetical protein
MNIEGMTREELISVVTELVEKGKLSVADLAKMNTAKRDAIDLFHGIICNKNHESGECSYYVEQEYKEAWELTDHVTWSTHTKDYCQGNSIKYSDLFSILHEVTGIAAAIRSHQHGRVVWRLLREIGIFRPELTI